MSQQQKECLKGFKDTYRLYGTIQSGNTSKGYIVKFDIFTVDCKNVSVGRKRLKVVAPDEEEVPGDLEEDARTRA